MTQENKPLRRERAAAQDGPKPLRGIGSGFLEEQRRSRAWHLALGGIFGVLALRWLFNLLVH